MDNPHVVILPFPAQGHIKPMLMLADLLSRAGFTISFVNTDHSHRRLLDQADGGAAFRCCYPGINFLSIPDGLPPDHPRTGLSAIDLLYSTSTTCKPIFKDLVASMSHAPACVIADGIMSFAVDAAVELGIPAISFRTYNATSTWTYFHLQKLVEEGEIPVVAESEDLEIKVSCIPGLDGILRRRDLPSICRFPPQSPLLQFFINQASKMREASALILNTFEELEAPMISRLRSIFPTVYTVGPLHSAGHPPPSNSSSLLQTDQSCTGWLDSQPSRSVLYVSFGSVAVLTRGELMEIWHGLVNSEVRFLWAIRPDLIWGENGPGGVPDELRSEMGRIVGWAPQEEVLAHEAVGGFLTHCGWNSVLESICAGKPMICRPMVAEQQVNGRCVGEMWGLGVDMNRSSCDRSTVERAVRDLMEGGRRRDEMLRSTAEIARLARDSVRDGGSSHGNLNNLIADIKLLHSKAQNKS